MFTKCSRTRGGRCSGGPTAWPQVATSFCPAPQNGSQHAVLLAVYGAGPQGQETFGAVAGKAWLLWLHAARSAHLSDVETLALGINGGMGCASHRMGGCPAEKYSRQHTACRVSKIFGSFFRTQSFLANASGIISADGAEVPLAGLCALPGRQASLLAHGCSVFVQGGRDGRSIRCSCGLPVRFAFRLEVYVSIASP